MRWLAQLWMRLQMLFGRGKAGARLDDELRFHLEQQIAENMAAGMDAEEARYAALRSFGNPALLREQTRATWSWNWLESLWRDLRYSARTLARAPGFAVLMVLTLALGIGSNTAIFTLTWNIMLKGLPVPEPGELIRYTFRKADSELGLSYLQYLGLEKQQGVASGVFAWQNSEATLRQDGQAEKIPVGFATGGILDVLKVQPWLGQGFELRAGEAGSAYRPEAMLTYRYWQTKFHGDPAVVGRALNIENNSITITGVLPPGFDGVEEERRIDVLLPLSFEPVLHGKASMMNQSGAFWLTVIGRLRPGNTLSKAKANLAAISATVTEVADPSHLFLKDGFFSGYELGVESGRSGRSWLRTRYGKPLLALEGLCALMMLLCAVNAALLVLSRVSGRLHEFAMRGALGASRGRLLTQVLTETALLSLGGLAVGALLGWELAKILVSMISGAGAQPALHLQIGAVVVLFAAAITIGAAFLAGIWPAWRASHTTLASNLKQTGSARTAKRLGRWIIPVQVALGVLMLNVALLLTGTLLTYLRENSGFAAGNVVLAELESGSSGLSQKGAAGKALEYLRQVRGMPGVQSAALMSMAPMNNGFSVSEYYARDANGNLRVNRQIWPEQVSMQYFAVMGTRLMEGRSFTDADLSGEQVCILSRSAATYFFPDKAALGESLNDGDGKEKTNERTSCRVIGIAEDARMASLLQPAPAMVYFPIERETDAAFTYSTIAVRAANSQLGTDAIRSTAVRVFPSAASPRIYLFRDAANSDLSRQRLLGSVSGGFALLALALLATGLYGILSRTVTEQQSEIGIRMALGARREQIVSTLARTAAVHVGVGLIAGVLMAALAARLLRTLLFGVSFQSPEIALATLGVLLGVLILAFVVPAARAASVDPIKALRME